MTMTYNQTSAPAPTASRPQRAARIAIAGSASALALLLILHAVRPDLDPAWHVLSEYALGPTGWMMTLTFLCYSAASAGVLVALLPHVGTIGGRTGLAFLAFATVGLALATFPIDPVTTAPGEGTFSGTMHGIASMIGVSGQVVAGIVVGHALARRAPWKPVRLPLLLASHLIWIGVVMMFVSLSILIQQQTMDGPWVIGWANRLMMLAYAIWLIIAAWPLARK